MTTPVFTSWLAHKESSTLDTSKDRGPDQMHPKMLKWLAAFLVELMADPLTTHSPSDWTATVIRPIFKIGDPEDVTNYHPVSLTSVVCMIFKWILERAILSSLSECNAIICCQYGFPPRRPCLSNLLVLEEAATRLMGHGKTAYVVYSDFA